MKNIVIASGKGGTGKTFIATNIAKTLEKKGKDVTYLDCDVEEPNGHLFLKPDSIKEIDIEIEAPLGVDEKKCIACGKCVDACSYNAIALIKDKVLFFPELCHVCGGCSIVCPTDAIVEDKKKIGTLKKGKSGDIEVNYALLETGEGGMSPRLIQKVKNEKKEGINIIDAPPGTACPAVESIIDADLAVLVADPTPFGINDLKLAVNMCRKLKTEPVVLVNRADYKDKKLREYCKKANLEIIGEIPHDRKIAEIYSNGDLVVEEGENKYKKLFKKITETMESVSEKKRLVRKPETISYEGEKIKSTKLKQNPEGKVEGNVKELVVISGKGGTGKTSITASFAALCENPVLADCDVDAADLHLITEPTVRDKGLFSGGITAEIDPDKCTSCGKCREACRFDAIKKTVGS
ncbi:MAG: P-loop NTPase, partial [Candidatus Thermoplasmatota archaeon]